MAVVQGDIWWADLPEPLGSGPGFHRPVVIVQGDSFNRTALATAVCVVLTTNIGWARAPGNVLLSARVTRLPRDSVANVSQMITIDQRRLTERVSVLPRPSLDLILGGIDIMLGRS